MTIPSVKAPAGTVRRVTHPLLAVVLAQLIYAGGAVAGMLLVQPLAALFPGLPHAVALLVVVTLGHAPIFLMLWAWLRFYERRSFGSLGLTWDRRAWRQHAVGFGLGVVFIAGWLALQYAIGNLRVEGTPVVWGLLYLLPVFYLSRLVMISIEEILYRGWLLDVTIARWGVPAGVAVSSAAFALFHFAGPLMLITSLHPFHPVLAVNLVLWSVLAALLTLRGRNLWAALAFHATPLWLASHVFVAGPRPPELTIVLLSQPNASPWTGEAALAGPFTGLPTTVLLAVLCAVVHAVNRRRVRAG